jgi:hypothetical protein
MFTLTVLCCLTNMLLVSEFRAVHCHAHRCMPLRYKEWSWVALHTPTPRNAQSVSISVVRSSFLRLLLFAAAFRACLCAHHQLWPRSHCDLTVKGDLTHGQHVSLHVENAELFRTSLRLPVRWALVLSSHFNFVFVCLCVCVFVCLCILGVCSAIQSSFRHLSYEILCVGPASPSCLTHSS